MSSVEPKHYTLHYGSFALRQRSLCPSAVLLRSNPPLQRDASPASRRRAPELAR